MSRYPNRIFTLFVFVAAIFGLTAAEAQEAAPNPRIALVIGNATYRDAALATPANDAGLVAQTLQAAGFDVVGARDLDGQSLRAALRDFLQKAAAAGPDMQAFVYLSGRGVQYNGDNYFVPVDAQIARDADVPIEAIRVTDFTHALAATPGKARIIVLDAARANPYASQGSPLAPGLALVDPEHGELIAFNAAPGTLAGEEEGPYGVYAKTLAGAIRQGGVDIAQALDQTRVSVNAETQGALLPWSASKLGAPFYVFERAADAPPAAPPLAKIDREPIGSLSAEDAYAAALERDTMEGYRQFLAAYPHSNQARRVRAILAVRREAAYWRRTVSKDTPRAYWTYLNVYPRGPHVADAQRRLAMLSAEFQPPPDFRPESYANLPPPPPDERFYEEQPIYAFDDLGPPPPPPPPQYVYVEDDDWRDLPPPPPPPAVGILPVLGVALPIAAGAVAYHGLSHRNGIAPRGAPRFRPPPPAPPPLPAN
ncbi:MAG TPA: caspase family protein, partial [Roseiarcus sp.]|nr:caspase family protein [Roseiarcus sp.]